jgi:hypothetical protein
MSVIHDSSKGESNPVANAGGEGELTGEGNPGASQPKTLEEVLATNERLLKEAKKHRADYLATKKALDEIQQNKLKEQNQYKELYEDREAKLAELKKQVLKQNIASKVRVQAEKLGCVLTPEDLMKFGNNEILQYDESSLDVEGTDLFVQDIKTRYPTFFQAKPLPTINPASPGAAVVDKQLTPAEIAKLPTDKKLEYWKKALSQQN